MAVVVVVVVVIVFSSCSFHSFLLYVLMLQSATKRLFSIGIVGLIVFFPFFVIRSEISCNKLTRKKNATNWIAVEQQRHIDTANSSRFLHILCTRSREEKKNVLTLVCYIHFHFFLVLLLWKQVALKFIFCTRTISIRMRQEKKMKHSEKQVNTF